MDTDVLKYLYSAVLPERKSDEFNMYDIETNQKIKALASMTSCIYDEIECDQCDFLIRDNMLEIHMLSMDAIYHNSDSSDFYKLIQIASSVNLSEKDGNLLTIFKIPKFW